MAKKFTLDDVSAHATSDDIWFIIHEKVYDVTKFLDEHPGGEEVLVELAGKDATQEFDDVGHSDEASNLMADYFVGDLTDEAKAALRTKATARATAAANGAGQSGFIPFIVAFVVMVALRQFGYI